MLVERVAMQAAIYEEEIKTQRADVRPLNISSVLRQHTASIDAALQGIFHSPEETRLHQARRIMGASVTHLSNDDLEIYLTEFQNLLEDWLDIFEREQFDGRTLKQVLGQG